MMMIMLLMMVYDVKYQLHCSDDDIILTFQNYDI